MKIVKNLELKIKSCSLEFKISKYILLILIFNFSLLTFNLKQAHASSMDSTRYRIEGGNINIAGGEAKSDTFNLSTTLGQTAATDFQSNGYIVKSGFQYIHSIIPFNFSISDTSIEFEDVKPNEFNQSTFDLAVSYGAAGKYQITASQDGPLTSEDKTKIIEPTFCDQKDKCLVTLAKPWQSKGVYGFGYNLAGDDIPKDFKNKDYFRPFPDLKKSEEPVTVMSSYNVGKQKKAQVNLRLDISPLISTGTYTTVIKFVATPSF